MEQILKSIAGVALFLAVTLTRDAMAQTPTVTPTRTPVATATPVERAWTVKEILAEAGPGKPRPPVNYCQGGIFQPCICASDVPRAVRYRPSVRECNNNAAIVLSGKFKNVFSAVVRDVENRDRYPEAGSGFGGCSFAEANAESPPARCSAFKVQQKFRAGKGKKESIFHCLGASGYSATFRRVVRITIKLADDPTSTNDPLVRYCLGTSRVPLN